MLKKGEGFMKEQTHFDWIERKRHCGIERTKILSKGRSGVSQ